MPCASKVLFNLTQDWQRLIGNDFSSPVVFSSHGCRAQVFLSRSANETTAHLKVRLSQFARITGFLETQSVELEFSKPMEDYRLERLQKKIVFLSSQATSIVVVDSAFNEATIEDAPEIVLMIAPIEFDYGNAEYEVTVTGDVSLVDDPPPDVSGEVFADAVYDIAHEFAFTDAVQTVSDTQIINLDGDGCNTGFVELEVPLSTSYPTVPWLGGFFGLRFNLPARSDYLGNSCVAVGPIGMMEEQQFFIGEINFVAFHIDCMCDFEHLNFDVLSFVFAQPVAIKAGEFAVKLKMSPKTQGGDGFPVICGNPLP